MNTHIMKLKCTKAMPFFFGNLHLPKESSMKFDFKPVKAKREGGLPASWGLTETFQLPFRREVLSTSSIFNSIYLICIKKIYLNINFQSKVLEMTRSKEK